MKCEICRLINKLGIPQSAHDLWFCPDKERKVAAPVEDSLSWPIAA
jgi:DNA topoisomerase IB